MDTRDWLRRLGLEQYAAKFEQQAIDADALPSLTADDLKDLGVDLVGHRRRLLEAIAALRGDQAAVASRATPCDEAERRTITILFCDLVGSTALASGSDPEDFRDLMTKYQRTCTETVSAFGGHVARYMGDGLLAYFGYPQARENEAESALRAGLALVTAAGRILTPADDRLSVRVGIATGLVVVGDLIGHGDSAERTVVGDTPNLAARFQELARPDEVLCSDRTRRLASGLFNYEDLGERRLKGFPSAVRAWRVVSERAVESRFRAIHEQPAAGMVGRSHERSLLFDRWSTTKGGEGQVLLITGDSGIGKSRLIQEFIDQAAGELRYRFEFQCSPHFRGTAFSAVMHQLEVAAGLASTDDAVVRRHKLGRLLAEIPGGESWTQEMLALMGLGTLDESGESARQRILGALVGRIECAAAFGPVLCVVEDAHWIDPSTHEFVTLLAERIPHLPVLLVVSYRLDFECPWISFPHATSLKLNRLNRAQSAALVRAVAAGHMVPEGVLEDIVEKTDGVPLFVEEVTKALVESLSATGAADGSHHPASRPAVAVPDTLHDTLLSRLDRDETAKQVAQVASVIGRSFDPALLSVVADIPGDRIQAGLEKLVGAGLIMRSTVGSEVVYTFRHGLLHEVTYGTMLLRRRRELHRRIAVSIADPSAMLARQRPELIAHHYDAAEDFAAAAQWWLEAGRHALRNGSYNEALGHLEAGLAAVMRMPSMPARSERELPIQVAIAETCRSGRFSCEDRALEACRRARELSAELANIPVLIRTLRLEFGIFFNRPDLPSMERVGREFERLGKVHGDRVAEVLARQVLGCVSFFRGNVVRASSHFRSTLSAAKQVSDASRLAEMQFPVTALTYLSWSELLAGRVAEARRTAKRAIAASEDISRFAESLALTNILVFDRLLGDEGVTQEHLARLRMIAEARGMPYWSALVGMHDGLDDLARGDVDAGLSQVRRALSTFSDHSVQIEIPFYLGQIAESLIRAGCGELAREMLRDAFTRVERTGERWFLPELHRLRAEALREEDPLAAQADARQAMVLARTQGELLLELRAATSLCRMVSDGSTKRTGVATLRRLVGRFDAGLRTRDLAGARMALDGTMN